MLKDTQQVNLNTTCARFGLTLKLFQLFSPFNEAGIQQVSLFSQGRKLVTSGLEKLSQVHFDRGEFCSWTLCWIMVWNNQETFLWNTRYLLHLCQTETVIVFQDITYYLPQDYGIWLYFTNQWNIATQRMQWNSMVDFSEWNIFNMNLNGPSLT